MTHPPTRFRHTHVSGRFDRSPHAVQVAISGWAAISDLLTFTEFADEKRVKALKTAGFDVVHVPGNGYDEYALMARRDLFRVIWSADEQLTDLIQGGGRHTPPKAMYVLLRALSSGELLLVSILHTPSGVQAGRTWRRSSRVPVYQSTIIGWKAHTLDIEHEFAANFARPIHTLMVADLNLDVRQSWVQSYLANIFPKRTLNWLDQHLPRRGTHFRRIIDGSLLKRIHRIGKTRLLRRGKKARRFSDHTGYTETLELG